MLHSFTRCTCRPARLTPCLAVAALVLGVAAPASAQLFRANPSTGPSRALDVQGAGATLGTDVAYDSTNNIFLVVAGFGAISGQFVDASGAPLGPAFSIMSGTTYFGHYPRAIFSPDANSGRGGFLVTWHEDSAGAAANEVHGLMVAYPTGVISPDVTISSALSGLSYWNTAAPGAYSLTSRRFLVVWTTIGWGIQGRFVDAAGTPIGSIMPIENPGGARWPAVAWNSVADEFGISYCAFGAVNAWAAFRRLRASDGLLSPRTSFGYTTGTYASDVAYNSATTNYVMTWSTARDVQSAAFDVAGNLLGSGLVSIYLNHSADNLGLSFNPFSRTFLVVGHSGDVDDLGVELNSNGAPDSSYVVITSGATRGAYFPRPAANTTVGQWAVSFSLNLKVGADQIVGTTSTNGGSSDPLGTPYTGGGGSGGTGSVCTTPDPFAAMGGGTCVNGGWVPRTGSTGGSPCTTPDPFAAIGGGTCVNGGWVPPASTGTPGGTGSCTTVQPAPGWTCVNGGWVPPGSTGTPGGTGGCTTPDPFASMGGGTCVNGGWVPPGSTGSPGGTGSCTTVQPAPGWTCVNGGWVPPTGSTGSPSTCTTVQPGPGWTCVNGGWVPPTGSTAAPSTCSTVQPGPGWTCVNGGWVPPGSASGATGTCTAPDPFASVGGGVCVNGGWIPRGGQP